MQTEQAYVARGTKDDVPAILTTLERSSAADADLFVRIYGDLGIDDARDIRERSSLRGVGGARVFVIVAASLTSEAQNALLKTFEEPPAGATFVLVVPAPETLLSTLRSRMQTLDARLGGDGSPIDVAAFIAARPAARLDALKPLTAADEKDTAGTLAFLAALEREIARKQLGRDAAEAVYRARSYILDRGAARKTLLESVALLLPAA